MSRYVVYDRNCYNTTDERPEFNSDAYRSVGKKPSDKMAICHGISFGTMKECIAIGLNYFKDGNFTRGTCILCGIVAAVLRIRIDYAGKEEVLNQNLLSVMPQKYKEYIEQIIAEFSRAMGYTPDEDADCILELLFNEPKNLRWGYSSWNESIGNGFDPTDFYWQGSNVVLSDLDSIAINNLMWLIPEVEVNIYTFLYGRNKSKKGIGSSQNNYPLPDSKNMEESDDIEVFYHNYVFDKYLCITTGEEII